MTKSAKPNLSRTVLAAAALMLFSASSVAATYVVRIGAPVKCPVTGCVTTGPGAGGAGGGNTGGGTGDGGGTPPVLPGAVTLSPSTIDFGNGVVPIGQQGLLIVTLTNSGAGPLSVTGIDVLDKRVFNQSNNCGSTLAPGASCTINANFVPTGISAESDVLAVTTGSGSPTLATMTGTALAPSIGLSGSTSFGTITELDTATATFTFNPTNASQVRNSYAALVGGTNLTVQSTTCGTQAAPLTLNQGGSCSLTLRWAPTGPVVLSGAQLQFRSETISQNYNLTGTATSAEAVASLSTQSLNFGNVDYPSSSTQSVTVTNTGGGSMDVSAVNSGSSKFTFVNNCAVPLGRNESCTIDVTMTASSSSQPSETGTLAVTAGGQTQNVALSGIARRAKVDATKADNSSAANLDFGTILVGTQNDRVYTVRNNGQLTATGVFATLEASNSDFSLAANTCGTSGTPISLAAGASCSITLRWVPSNQGTISGTNRIVLSGAAEGLPTNLNFTGTANDVATAVTVSPAINGKTRYDLATETLIVDTAGTYTVTPASSMRLTAKMWGGGGDSQVGTNNAGAGGYAQGTFTRSTSFIISLPSQGGAGGVKSTDGTVGWSGGGYAGIFGTSVTQAQAILIAGGGGGSPGGSGAGGAGGGTSGVAGSKMGSCTPAMQGGGGTQSAGGAAGVPNDTNIPNPTAGSALAGGSGGGVNNGSWQAGPGGGGGYFGGGGGSGGGSCRGGAGGGSGYAAGSLTGVTLTAGSGTTPGNSSDADRGNGGTIRFKTGRVVIRLTP